jgi:hypothetical protein
VCVWPHGIGLLSDWQEEMSTSCAPACSMQWKRCDSAVRTFRQQVDIVRILKRCCRLYTEVQRRIRTGTQSEIVLCVTFQSQVVTLYTTGFAVCTRMQDSVLSLKFDP